MSKCSIQTIPAGRIQTDGLQVRAEQNRQHVEEMAELFDADNPSWPDGLPPVVLFFDGESYYLADGHHRLAAALEAGCAEIRASVRPGDRTAALWHAIGANVGHGLRRTNEDKRRAVSLAHQLDSSLSNRAIAKKTGVSPGLADYLLREIRAQVPKLGTCEKRKGVDGKQYPAKKSSLGTKKRPSPDASQKSDSADDQTKSSPCNRPDHSEPDDEPGRQEDAEPAAPPDTLGVPCQSEGARRSFESLDHFDQMESLIRQAQKLANQIAKMPGGELYRAEHLKIEHIGGEERFRCTDLANALAAIRHCRPHTQCPACIGKGAAQHDCRLCKGLPYINESAYERCSENLQHQLLSLKGEQP